MNKNIKIVFTIIISITAVIVIRSLFDESKVDKINRLNHHVESLLSEDEYQDAIIELNRYANEENNSYSDIAKRKLDSLMEKMNNPLSIMKLEISRIENGVEFTEYYENDKTDMILESFNLWYQAVETLKGMKSKEADTIVKRFEKLVTEIQEEHFPKMRIKLFESIKRSVGTLGLKVQLSGAKNDTLTFIHNMYNDSKFIELAKKNYSEQFIKYRFKIINFKTYDSEILQTVHLNESHDDYVIEHISGFSNNLMSLTPIY